MATLNKVKRGQTVTEQVELINENVENINTELVQLNSDVTNNVAGYITSAEAPVQSVNSQTGDVTLSANDVGAFPNSTTVTALDINNTKSTGVYIGTDNETPVYLLVIKYSDNNIYQELIGSNFKKYRRFTTSWSEWVQDYSNEHPVTASDVTGINTYDSNTVLDVALLNSGTFVKANLKYNASTGSLWFGTSEFATKQYVDNAVNMIHSIIVNELPVTGVENTIYYVPDTTPETGNAYLEYVYVNGAWELLGATEVDLTPFLTKTEASQTYATKTENDGKVSKTTTVNGKALSSDITLTASDVGALPSDTPIPADLVHRYSNSTIASMLSGGDFSNGDMFIALDDGTYKIGHIYKYNNGLVDITDIPNDYVDLTNDQNIAGTKNFTGLLRYGGVTVATSDDISTTQGMIPTVNDSTITIQENGVAVDTFTLNQSSGKTINIPIPTKTSEFTNDGDGLSYQEYSGYTEFDSTSDYVGYYVLVSTTYTEVTSANKDTLNIVAGTTKAYEYSPFATKQYVADNGGKIDTISVNGTPQTITNKNVDITVPTKVSDLNNDSGFINGINSTDVTTALGYTPYNATNPNDYQTETQMNTALANKEDTVANQIAQFFVDNPSFVYNGAKLYLNAVNGKSIQSAEIQAYLTALFTWFNSNPNNYLIPYSSNEWAVLQSSNTTTYTIYYALLNYGIIRVISLDTSTYQFVDNFYMYLSNAINKWSNDLVNYYTKNDTYSQTEVNTLIANIQTNLTITSTLPSATADTYFNTSKTIYLVPLSSGSGNDYYNEYITVRSGTEGSYTYSWEKIGNTQVDLTNYVTTNTAQTISATKTFSVDQVMNNNIYLRGKTSGGTPRNLIGMLGTDSVYINNENIGNTYLGGDAVAPVSVLSTTNLGVSSSHQWNNIYGKTIYQNGKQVANAEDIPTVPTNVSSFTNDAGYLTSHQDISGKLDKVTTNNTVYGVDGSGNQTSYTVANSSSTGNAVAKYDSSGRLKAYTPSSNNDVANKSYVDGNFLAKSGGTMTGDIDWSSSNTSAWLKPYLLAFKNADTSQSPTYPYTGFYQWGDEWQVNARNSSNVFAHNLLTINNSTKVATFPVRPQVSGTNVALTSDIPDTSTLMPKSGGTFTGAVNFPNTATITAEGYVKGTWMYSSNATDNASWTDVWVNNAGWFYKRAKSSFKSDLGVPSVWSGTQQQYDAIQNKDSNTYYFIEEE